MQRLIPFVALWVIAVKLSADEAVDPILPDNHAQRVRVGTELFRQSIRPALLQHCVKCHGGEKVRGGLDLTSRERLLKGGDSGEVVDQSEPEFSYLLELIRHEEDPVMPPAADKLAEPLLKDFRRWVELGAPYDKPLIEKQEDEPAAMRVTESDRQFWSFRPLAHHEPPIVESDWPRTDTDHFVFAKLNDHQLSPSPPTDDHSRIRRAYLDVIGLPPSPDQIEAALLMSHRQLIDELLESQHYGERWARHWLDAARFAESHGFEQDYDRKFAFHYRDFVIKALNSDMPWDQFIRWQIAGDEIAPDEPLAMMATGFLGAGVFPTQLTEKEFEIARYDELDDIAATIGTAMLGLTIGCARCHDHKFDPIPAEDYYRFISTFTTTIRSEVDLELDPKSHQAALAKWSAQHEVAVSALDQYESDPSVRERFETWLRRDEGSLIQDGEWIVLDPSEARSNQKATSLKLQADGAVLASGKPPASETYVVKAEIESRVIRYVRIEALTHESMKRNGPGRAGNGNFALSDLRLIATSKADRGAKGRPIQLVTAQATHQQNEGSLSVASAIDSDAKGTGWAVDFGGIGKDQAAVFKLESPLEATDGVVLEFWMTFANNAAHSMGRFRLSVSTSTDPPVVVGEGKSQALIEALAALAKGRLSSEHRRTLFPHFAAGDQRWNELSTRVKSSLEEKPEPNVVKVQVSSEGLPPTKHHADGRGFPHFYPETYFLNRGDPNQKQGIAPSGFLQVLMRGGRSSADWQQPPPSDWTQTSYRRTAMANWITDGEHGAGQLLARVIVNRLWHHHFGRGIVATPNDFGLQGSPPTHPELLDFLATRLIENGWKLKALHREILLSATWLQSQTPSPAKAAVDLENRWFWRFPTHRLEAEIIRDAMLAASGQLDPRMFGPGTLDPGHRRRSIYFMIKRSRLVPMMQIFDQPEPLTSQGRRPSTTIAPQALLFMNNPHVIDWAAGFAESVDGQTIDDAIREIYLRALGRHPSPQELVENRGFVEQQTASYGDAKNPRRLALADLCQAVFALNEFVYLP